VTVLYYIAWPFIKLYELIASLFGEWTPKNQHFFQKLVTEPYPVGLQLAIDAKRDPNGTTLRFLKQLVHYPEDTSKELISFLGATQPKSTSNPNGRGSGFFEVHSVEVDKEVAKLDQAKPLTPMSEAAFVKGLISLLPKVTDALFPSLHMVIKTIRELDDDNNPGLDPIYRVLHQSGLSSILVHLRGSVKLFETYRQLPAAGQEIADKLAGKNIGSVPGLLREVFQELCQYLVLHENGFDADLFMEDALIAQYLPEHSSDPFDFPPTPDGDLASSFISVMNTEPVRRSSIRASPMTGSMTVTTHGGVTVQQDYFQAE
jgi:hypothetical protein